VSSYCEHCEGQRFDRARVLRALRQVKRDLGKHRREKSANEAIELALDAVRTLEIPHLEWEEEEGQLVH
jgi:hypothetical protein